MACTDVDTEEDLFGAKGNKGGKLPAQRRKGQESLEETIKK